MTDANAKLTSPKYERCHAWECVLCRNGAMEASTSGREMGVSVELRKVEFG
jgi:hypothetical protein